MERICRERRLAKTLRQKQLKEAVKKGLNWSQSKK